MYDYSRTSTDEKIDRFPETLGLEHIWDDDTPPPQPVLAVTRAAHKLQISGQSQQTLQPKVQPLKTDSLKSSAIRDDQSQAADSSIKLQTNSIRHETVSQTLGSDAPFADLFTPEQIRLSQLADEFCGDMIRWLEGGLTPETRERETRCQKRKYDNCIKNGMLFHIWEPIPNQGEDKLRLVLPKPLQEPVIRHVHTSKLSCHLGGEKTIGMIRQRFIFKELYEAVRLFIAKCEVCLKVKPSNKKVVRPPALYELTEQPFQRLHLDYAGPLVTSRSGSRFIAVCSCACSAYVIAWSCRNLTAEALARHFYNKVVCIYGPPIKICSDNASTFRSAIWREVARLLQINLTFVAPYTPRSNGRAESAVKSVMQVLRCMVQDHGPAWDEHLQSCCYALNNSLHAGHQLTPHSIVFGKNGRIPIDIPIADQQEQPLFQVIRDMQRSQAAAFKAAVRLQGNRDVKLLERRTNKSTGTEEIIEGDVVFWRKPNVKGEGPGKLSVTNHGPYLVTRKLQYTANIRHLHTGEFSKYPVNLEQLRIAKGFHTPPDGTIPSNPGPLYSRDHVYRAHRNEQ